MALEEVPDRSSLPEAALRARPTAGQREGMARWPVRRACLAWAAVLPFVASAQFLLSAGVSGLSIDSSPASGDTYGVGETITATVTFSGAVTVTGSPQLELSIGSNARQASYSSCARYLGVSGLVLPDAVGTCRDLTFNYTVHSTDSDTNGISIADDTSGLVVDTALSLNGGMIQDASSSSAASLALGLSAISDSTSHKVDGSIDRLPPSVSSVSFDSSPRSSSTYGVGETITVAVQFSEPVTVTGSPQLALTIGAATRQAGYARCTGDAGDATGTCRSLYFSYVVQAADSDSDGIAIAANALALNSATIQDASNNNAGLGLGSHVVSDDTDHKVDGSIDRAPAVSSVAFDSSPRSSDTYGVGETITLAVGFDEPVTVAGSPQLALTIGTATRQAGYARCTGNAEDATGTCRSLYFSYVVQAADSDSDGIAVAANALTLNSATIQDAGSNNAGLGLGSHAVSGDTDHKVDGSIDRAPAVSSVAFASSPVGGATYLLNETITLAVGFNEPVTVTGSPQLALTIGTVTRQAGYARCTGNAEDATGTCRSLYFSYVVQAADSDSDGIAVAANALTLNSATIQDAGGNNAGLGLGSHAVSGDASHKVNGSRSLPAVSTLNISSSPLIDDTYAVGETITVVVRFSWPVKVAGSPQLALTIGTATRQAGYLSCIGIPGDTAGTCRFLIFSYVVQPSDSDSDGIGIATTALTLNGGTIRDTDNRNAVRDLGRWASAGYTGHKVDGSIDRPPIVLGLLFGSSPNVANTYIAGETITSLVEFSEPVTVATVVGNPQPQLELSIASGARQANYERCVGRAGDPVGTCRFLYFGYVVQSSDKDVNGIGIAADALDRNGVTIRDVVGNNADLDLGSHAISNDAGHKVDGGLPVVTGLFFDSSPQRGDTYGIGETITVVVGFSETVTTTGSPQLALAIGTATRQAGYARCAGNALDPMGVCRFLYFSYVVQSSDGDADGIGIARDALGLNGGTIRDAANNANLSLEIHAIGSDAEHKVDGVLPTVARLSIDSSPQSGDTYGAGETISAVVGLDEPVTVAGSPQLALTIGSAARQAGYSHCFVRNAGDPPGSCRSLVFRYLVQASDSDSDGISIAAGALTLNSGTIRDAGSNAANLDLGSNAISNSVGHKVDGTLDRAPAVASLLFDSSPQSGSTYGAGELIRISVGFDEPIVVVGSPQLALAIGVETRQVGDGSCSGSALDPEGTCRWLPFRYLVQSSDADTDGIGIAANALTLNGGTIRDATGNDANPALGGHAVAGDPNHKVDGSRAGAPAVAGLSFASEPYIGDAYGIGETLAMRVEFDKPVRVVGHPQLALTIGGETRMADYATCSDDSGAPAEICWLLSFRYVVRSTDSDTDGIGVNANALRLNGGRISGAGGNSARLRLGSHAIANDPNHKVDASSDHAPVVAGLSFDSRPLSDDAYGVGEVVIARLEFNEPVRVAGRPQLLLDIASGDRTADHRHCAPDPGGVAGTCRFLLFRYVVQSTDSDTDGIGVAANALTLNGGTIRDTGDNDAELGLGHHAINQDLARKIDGSRDETAVATRLYAGAMPSNGASFDAGETLRAVVRFAKVVSVSGRPQLTLSIGERVRQATYASRNDMDDLVFEYALRTRDAGLEGLIAVDADALTLNGGAIQDQTGKNASLSLAGLAYPFQRVRVSTPRPLPNRPPEVAGVLEDVRLRPDAALEISLADAFRDPNGDRLSWVAASDSPRVATARATGSALRVAGWRQGRATVTVTATDPGGLSASQAFAVEVGEQVSLAGDVSVLEGGTARLTVELSGPLAKMLELGYRLGMDEDPATADADENDYEGPAGRAGREGREGREGRLTIPPGKTSAAIEIPIGDDADIEPAREVFMVTLSPPDAGAGVELGPSTSATVTIEEGVCDRTAGVRDGLRGERDCNAITDQDLAAKRFLDLAGQGIATLQRLDFLGMPELRLLGLSNNRLSQWPVEALASLPKLISLYMDGNRLRELPAGAFAALPSLTRLHLSNNQLSSLPAGLFDEAAGLLELQLQDNPGAPFSLTLEVRRADREDPAAPGPAELQLAVAEGAPIALSAGLTATGGVLAASSTSLAAGRVLGEERLRLTPDDGGAAVVTVGEVSGVPRHYQGLSVVAGPPLVLFKIPPTVEMPIPAQELEALGEARRLNLRRFFSAADFETLICAAASSDPALVAASVADCLLTISPSGDGEGGMATIRVTVRDGDGLSTTLSFEVTVQPAPRRLARPWLLHWLMQRAEEEQASAGDGSR